MEELSIKVTIAERMYPLTIKVDAEETVRKAAKEINEKVQELAKSFTVKDKQDLLAMAILQYAVEAKNIEGRTYVDDTEVASKLLALDTKLTNFLSPS